MNHRRFFTALGTALLGLLVAGEAGAGILTYSGTATAVGNGPFAPLSLPKFDTTLGTLDAVTVTVDYSKLFGSFSVTADALNEESVNVEAAEGRVTVRQNPANALGFTQLGQTAFSVGTTPALPVAVSPGSSQSFTVTSQDVFVNSAQTIGSSFWSAYESAGGSGTVDFQFRNVPAITATGGDFSVSVSNFQVETAMTVTYAYTPVPVPEPSTYAMAAAAAGLLGLMRRRQP